MSNENNNLGGADAETNSIPKTVFSQPLSFMLGGSPIDITEYVGFGKFRGFNEFGKFHLYSWDDLKRGEIENYGRGK